jgi:hypothetical protein
VIALLAAVALVAAVFQAAMVLPGGAHELARGNPIARAGALAQGAVRAPEAKPTEHNARLQVKRPGQSARTRKAPGSSRSWLPHASPVTDATSCVEPPCRQQRVSKCGVRGEATRACADVSVPSSRGPPAFVRCA